MGVAVAGARRLVGRGPEEGDRRRAVAPRVPLARQGVECAVLDAEQPRERHLQPPLDGASMPSAPEPANRSSTRAPGSAVPTMLIHASRTRSAVGRTASPAGALMVRPRQRPATIRTDYV